MADVNSNNPELLEAGDIVTLSLPRRNIAIDAAGEIEQLADILKGLLRADPDHMGACGIASRIRFLSHCLMAAIGDDMEKTQDIAERLAA